VGTDFARLIHGQVPAAGVTSFLRDGLGDYPKHAGNLAQRLSATLNSNFCRLCASTACRLRRLESLRGSLGAKF
jgi:hypothetical protein